MDSGSLKKDIETIIINIKEEFTRISNKELPEPSDRIALLASMETLYKKMVVFDHVCSQESSRLNPSVIEEQIDENNTIAEVIVEKEIVEPVQEIIESKTIAAMKEEEVPIMEITEEPVFTSIPVETKIETLATKEEPKSLVLPDIKSNIGINDKFQFIADLFQNNSEKYEAAIKQLNSFNTKELSLLFIEELRQHYNWKEDDYTAQQLTNIVTRRFL